MSSSGRRTPVFISRHRSNLSKSQFDALPPVCAHLPSNIPSGLYSFIQIKTAPRTIFLMPANKYKSLHARQTSYAGLTTDDLLSAGEIVIGGHGQIAAWSFRTGSLYDTLGLENPDREGVLMKAVGLPLESFYDVKGWIEFKEGGVNHFENFFTEGGFAKTINGAPGLMINPEAENIQQQREVRNAKENIARKSLGGAMQKLYQVLQENRDEYERTIRKPVKKADMLRSASSGQVADEEKLAASARLLAEQKLQSQSERQKVRILGVSGPGEEDLSGAMNEASLITRIYQHESPSNVTESVQQRASLSQLFFSSAELDQRAKAEKQIAANAVIEVVNDNTSSRCFSFKRMFGFDQK
jgi:hypothetical protein